jgi:large subunit ribosomal protein L6
MSRVGKNPVTVPAGVQVAIVDQVLTAKGKLGQLSMPLSNEVDTIIDDGKVTVKPKEMTKVGRAHWGTTRALIATAVQGVLKGYERKLEIVGVGWGAKVQGKKLVLTVGYANTLDVGIPEGVKVEVNQTMVTVSGPDKQAVGEFASKCRAKRKPEPYNGKGIKYTDEVIQRKQGKAFGS